MHRVRFMATIFRLARPFLLLPPIAGATEWFRLGFYSLTSLGVFEKARLTSVTFFARVFGARSRGFANLSIC